MHVSTEEMTRQQQFIEEIKQLNYPKELQTGKKAVLSGNLRMSDE